MTEPNIVHDDLDAVWIPGKTSDGSKVSIQSGERNGTHIMHAESPDLSELYFELTAYAAILDQDELAASQQQFLNERSRDGNITSATIGDVGKFNGLTFDFAGTLQGRWKERRFLFLANEVRSFRVVHDPTSSLNAHVLNSLSIRGIGSA